MKNLELKHYLNEALNKVLEQKGIIIDTDKLENDSPLEQDYYNLLNNFEEHIKLIQKINNE